MKNISKLFVLFLIFSCATSKKAANYQEATTPEINDQKAVLYIFRNYAEPTIFPGKLKINGKKVASLNQQGFTWIYVSPGEKDITFGWPLLAGMPKVDFKYNFEAGKYYGFEMKGSSELGSSIGNNLAFHTKTMIVPTEFEEIEETIRNCCRYVKPKLQNID